MVGEAAAGEQQCAGAGGPQHGYGDLCRDDGADDIDVICGPEPRDRRVEDLAGIRQRSVVHGNAGGAWGAEDPLERRTVAVQIFDVCAHRLDLKPAATQLRGELLDRFAAGDECAAKAFAAEAPNNAGADAGSGPDQQEVTRVNRLGHMPPPGRASPGCRLGPRVWWAILARRSSIARASGSALL